MKILLAHISSRKAAAGPAADLLAFYVERSNRYIPTSSRVFQTEASLLAFVSESATRTRPAVLLADSRGKQLTSEEGAAVFAKFQDSGTQQVILAIGPADGWSAAALTRADQTLAFGRITLPHELAAVIAAEQIYRWLTILAGHPYHSGH